MVRFGRLVAGVAALSSARGVVATCDAGERTEQDDATDSDLFQGYPEVEKAKRDDGPDLRILPLGASIMSGVGSPQHSGMRKWVRMALRNDDYDVNMVGTRRDGDDMTDADHEAESGAVLTDVRDNLQNSLAYKPNVVMINAGTNNANKPEDLDEVLDQMEDILKDIWGADDMSDTCIILSTLLPTTHPKGMRNRLQINDDYRQLVKDYAGKNCIYLADMEPEGEGSEFLSTDKPIWADKPKVHPNNEGHKRMAYVFYASIQEALRDGKVKEPAPIEEEDDGCDEDFADGVSAGVTQKGFGLHDGIYYHSSVSKGFCLLMLWAGVWLAY